MKKFLAISALAMVLVGCDQPIIDTTSDASIKESIAKVRESLPENKKTDFDNAIKVTVFSNIDFADLMKSGLSGNQDEINKKILEPLSGKTGDEVISYANQVVADREMKQKEQALQEIKELEERKDEATKAVEELKKFEVIKSRFSMEKESYGRDQPIITLVVKNNTNKPVARAYFHGVIASKERAVPWLEKDFNYEISGGIEPGEQVEWNLAPNKFSEWGKVDAPSDAILTVTVVRLDGADNKPIFDATTFSAKDQDRLEKLKKDFDNFKSTGGNN
ncbi:hypothetical protein OOP60_004669 [Salmonella enterica]|nr:hypothetical protein [Salmonella enterica]EKB5474807.1 hypothetical protein [Salmonella enterica]ELL0514704.1 hypothetical protein [Salmonella enterica]